MQNSKIYTFLCDTSFGSIKDNNVAPCGSLWLLAAPCGSGPGYDFGSGSATLVLRIFVIVL
jgi:hypothetical protein